MAVCRLAKSADKMLGMILGFSRRGPTVLTLVFGGIVRPCPRRTSEQ
jgi:hypothetical protein